LVIMEVVAAGDARFARLLPSSSSFFFNASATTVTSTLSLHDALPISRSPLPPPVCRRRVAAPGAAARARGNIRGRPALCPARRRSEEHTSELQSRENLVCRLLLEKKKNYTLHTY